MNHDIVAAGPNDFFRRMKNVRALLYSSLYRMGEPPRTQLVSSFPSPNEFYQECFRRLVTVNIDETKDLKGGMSGTPVLAVKATITVQPSQQAPMNIGPLDAVVKVSSWDSFSKEKRNYDKLSNALRPHFAFVDTEPEPVIRVVGRKRDIRYYVMMEQLVGFEPLEKHVKSTRTDIEELSDAVWGILQPVFLHGERRKPVSGKMQSLYLARIHSAIEAGIEKHPFLRKFLKAKLDVNGVLLDTYRSYQREISKRTKVFEPRYLTITHGDCHSRNIMLRRSDRQYDARFVDIDLLEFNGDYVYDLGELFADLQLFIHVRDKPPAVRTVKSTTGLRKLSYKIPDARHANSLVNDLKRKAKDDLAGHRDYVNRWERRLQLAMARYLLSLIAAVDDKNLAKILYAEGLLCLKRAVEQLTISKKVAEMESA